MNTSQIHLALSHWDKETRDCFIGVYAEDQLPCAKINRNKFCLVFNTQPSTQPGEHWIAVFISKEADGSHRITYFDSLGKPPRAYNIINFLKKYSSTWTYNPHRLQGPTRVCAQYVIMFLGHVCRKRTFESFLNIFSRDRVSNDRIVFEYVCLNFEFLC